MFDLMNLFNFFLPFQDFVESDLLHYFEDHHRPKMREVMGSEETMENNNDNADGIEAIDANESVQENNPPDNLSTTNESESSVRN